MKVKFNLFWFPIIIFTLLLPIWLHAGEKKRVEIKDGWFYIDGEKFFIKGVCYFEQHDIDGKVVKN